MANFWTFGDSIFSRENKVQTFFQGPLAKWAIPKVYLRRWSSGFPGAFYGCRYVSSFPWMVVFQSIPGCELWRVFTSEEVSLEDLGGSFGGVP